VDAGRLAEALFGTHLAANVFLLGAAFQAGLIPVSAASLAEAIRLNGVEAERNLAAFNWGRKYHEDPDWVERFAAPPAPLAAAARPRGVARAISGPAVRRRVRAFVAHAATLPEWARPWPATCSADGYKDEYEVARLLTDPRAEARIRASGRGRAPSATICTRRCCAPGGSRASSSSASGSTGRCACWPPRAGSAARRSTLSAGSRTAARSAPSLAGTAT